MSTFAGRTSALIAPASWHTSRGVGIASILALFVAVNVVMIGVLGVRTGGDTPIYLEGAHRLALGEPLLGRQASYLGYLWFIVAAGVLHDGYWPIVILQVVAATGAALAVYLAGAELGGQAAGVMAVAMLALDFDTNRWHTYVLTDSLYGSALMLSLWAAYRAAQEVEGQARWLIAVAAVSVAGLIRPEGWFLAPATALYAIVTAPPRRRRLTLAITAIWFILIILTLPRLGGNVSAIGPNTMLRAGQTIWSYDGWRVPMPAGAPSQGSESTAALAYGAEYPLSTALLMVTRVGVHLVHARPFYSAAHNAAILLWLLPVYALAAAGWWNTAHRQLAWWCLAVIASQAVVVAIGHADWDGRYLAHVLPVLYPFAGLGTLASLRGVGLLAAEGGVDSTG